MDYAWLIDLNQLISTNNLFSYTIIGAKSLAMALLLFKIIGNFLQTAENSEMPKIGGIISIIGYGLLIVGSDWIVNSIETAFAGIEINISEQKPAYDNSIKQYLLEVDTMADDMSAMDRISFYTSLLPLYLTSGLMMFLQQIIEVLDFAVVGMYLIQRVFMLQLFKFIFPFAVALATTKGFEEMFTRWIKIYVGLFVLGIAYMAVIKFGGLVYSFIQQKVNLNLSEINYNTDLKTVFLFAVGAPLVGFLVKLGLLALVTKEVRGYFN
jgi:hypothetical protein